MRILSIIAAVLLFASGAVACIWDPVCDVYVTQTATNTFQFDCSSSYDMDQGPLNYIRRIEIDWDYQGVESKPQNDPRSGRTYYSGGTFTVDYSEDFPGAVGQTINDASYSKKFNLPFASRIKLFFNRTIFVAVRITDNDSAASGHTQPDRTNTSIVVLTLAPPFNF